MMMRLSEAAKATHGKSMGDDVEFSAVTTDSRQVQAGDLFVALKGERFDGHDFVADCLQHGAAAAVVSRRVADAGPQLLVDDTRLALGELAAYWRARFAIPLAAVTGSNGKTTVKEMLAAILRAAAGADAVLATQGNLNNDIGLPLTLLKLRENHRYAVAEMGMNHSGEIAYLSNIARPTVALVNNALPAHLEGLGSVENVARAKGEIFQGLAADGTAVINADDAFAGLWRELAAPHRIMTFGIEQPADVSADYRLLPDGSEITIKVVAQAISPANHPGGLCRHPSLTTGGDSNSPPHVEEGWRVAPGWSMQAGSPALQIPVHLHVAGLHNVRNALAATAAALAMGVSLTDVAAGLQGFSGAKGRLQRKAGLNGCALIDDTYNANPASVRAAVDVLAACPGTRILVLGDMGELGADAAAQHADIGRYVAAAGLDGLYTLGELGRAYGGRHFESPEALAAALLPELRAGVTVLVKGSRFMRMERVVELITTEAQTGK